MKKIFSLLVVILLVMSCSPDSSSNSATFSSVLIKRVVQNRPDGSLVGITNYTYNGAKLNQVTTDDFRYQYFYTGNLITKTEIYYLNDLAYIINCSYDPQNRLIQYKREAIGSGQIFRNVYHYNTDNTISVDQYFIYETGSEEDITPAKYFLNAQGEIEKIEQYFGSDVQVTTFAYDGHNNPLKNITGFSRLLIPEIGFNTNVLTQIYSGANPANALDRSYQYTYNADDYPVTMSRNVGTDQDATVQYFYE